MTSPRQRYRSRVLGRYLSALITKITRAESVSQNELARRAGLGKYLLAQWVHGVTHPGPANRKKLVRYFGADVDEINAAILADKMQFFLDGEKANLDAAGKALRKLRRQR